MEEEQGKKGGLYVYLITIVVVILIIFALFYFGIFSSGTARY
jgi:flagellar basal body-associated protein FliL